MKPIVRKFVLLPGVIFVAIGIAVGLSQLKPEPEKKEIGRPDLLVEVLSLQASSERFRIQSQGTVRPRTQTAVSAEVSGAIISLSPKFVAGGIFEKNEVLMRIDPTNYSVAVKRADALVKQRQIEFDGASKLRSQGYRAESEHASAAAALAAAEADLVGAKRDLERTYIRLPYEGMVLSKEADVGQFVNPGTMLGVTFATDRAEVRLPLTDRDLAFVEMPRASAANASGFAKGPNATLTATQKGRSEEWPAQVVRSEGVVDERSRVTYVVAEVVDPYRLHTAGTPLPIGTFVSAEIGGSELVDVVRVPRSALRGSDQVLVVSSGNTIEIRTVDVIRADGKYAYVGGGIVAGERITTTAIETPTNGMSVRTSDMLNDENADEKSADSNGAGDDAQIASSAEND